MSAAEFSAGLNRRNINAVSSTSSAAPMAPRTFPSGVARPAPSPVASVLNTTQIEGLPGGTRSGLPPGGRQGTGTTAAGPAGPPPPDDSKAYQDILVFEERLHQQLRDRRHEQRVYEAILLVAFILLFVTLYAMMWGRYRHPPRDQAAESSSLMRWLNFLVFLASISFLSYFFFFSDLYHDTIVMPRKLVPQVNRVLKNFNMQFNKEGTGEIHFQRKVPRRFQEGFAEAKRKKKEEAHQRGHSDGSDPSLGDGSLSAGPSSASATSTSLEPAGSPEGLKRRL
ncbi:hypothetical protein DFJ74DRAFT_681846 [Hyaloraphidium curvatum]|nr:hypothetical protein DFJ74DRAFT_681846 [Hyaloraphidium curvatum]